MDICTLATLQPSLDTLPGKLRDAKDAQHMSYQELADVSGVPKSSLTKFLTGKAPQMSIQYIAAICAALGLSLDELCGLKPVGANADDEAERLAAELEHQKELCAVHVEHVKRLDKALAGRRPVIYGLLALCILLIFPLAAYLSFDFSNLNVGFVRASGISPLLIAAAAVILLAVAANIIVLVRAIRERGRK